MDKHHDDIIELPKTPNVKRVTDASGRGWLCTGDSGDDGNFSSGGCQREDDVIYDRGFGG